MLMSQVYIFFQNNIYKMRSDVTSSTRTSTKNHIPPIKYNNIIIIVFMIY
jgi:hypothetical protein